MGPYTIATMRLLRDGSLIHSTLDLEHPRTGRKIESANISNIYSYPSATESLPEDVDPSLPPSIVPSNSSLELVRVMIIS